MKTKILIIFIFTSLFLSCNKTTEISNQSEPETDIFGEAIKPEEKKKNYISTEICYCCRKEYPAGEGFFYYQEFKNQPWRIYEQKNDLFDIAIGRYCCSPKCAMECLIPPR